MKWCSVEQGHAMKLKSSWVYLFIYNVWTHVEALLTLQTCMAADHEQRSSQVARFWVFFSVPLCHFLSLSVFFDFLKKELKFKFVRRAQSHTEAVESAPNIQTFYKKKALEFGHLLTEHILLYFEWRNESNVQPVRCIDLPVFPVKSIQFHLLPLPNIFFYLFPNSNSLTECLPKLHINPVHPYVRKLLHQCL